MTPIKKSLRLPILDEDVNINVTWHIIEIVEREYECGADIVVAEKFPKPENIQRRKIASIIANWCDSQRIGKPHNDVWQYVLTSPLERLGIYVMGIQAAVLYALGSLSSSEFDDLQKDEDGESGKSKTEA